MKSDQLRAFLSKWCRPIQPERQADFDKALNELLLTEKCPCCSSDDGFPLTEWQRSILFKMNNDTKSRLDKIDRALDGMSEKMKAITEFLNKENSS